MRSASVAVRVQSQRARLLGSSRILVPRPHLPDPDQWQRTVEFVDGLGPAICADAAEETADGYNV